MNSRYFISGIGTDVGKTIFSAIITEALEADYWKPIQAGDLHNSDTHKVRRLVSNKETHFHDPAFALTSAMSPHAAAAIEGIEISSEKIKRPETNKDLIIEGAGGLLVPLNLKETILDLVAPGDRVILVSRNYLGSINHSLLSLEVLKSRGISCFGIVFSGEKNEASEKAILEHSGVSLLFRIEEEPYFDANVVKEYAADLREVLDSGTWSGNLNS